MQLSMNDANNGSKLGAKYVNPGLNPMKVLTFRDAMPDEVMKTKSNSPYILLELEHLQTKAVYSEKLFMTPNARKYSESKITHMVDVLCTEADKSTLTNTESICQNMCGKEGLWKITGKWVKNKEGKSYIKADSLPLPKVVKGTMYGFVEKLNTNPSTLSFDPENKYDIKPYEPSSFDKFQHTSEVVKEVDNGGLPF